MVRIKQRKRKAVLVYQGGIANIFMVDCFNMATYGRNAKRVYQGDFASAFSVAFGLGLAGCVVRTATCNKVGDIKRSTWSDDLQDSPFAIDIARVDFN
jgi:hypothetical protein